MSIEYVILAALLIDFLLGDPRHFHPIAGFGVLATAIEKKFNRLHSKPNILMSEVIQRLIGIIALAILVIPITFILSLINTLFINESLHIFETIILFIAIGLNSLRLHANWVFEALTKSELPAARLKTGWLVSRDTSHLTASELSKATIESILENGNDAIFAAIFWFVIAGVPGVVLYRLVNTLDAMWGYKTSRYLYFGWATARLDDILNFIPAHLTAISYAITGKFLSALKCWIKQAYHWKSINAGIVMATGAGALVIELGGAAQYNGKNTNREILGVGKKPDSNDIKRAIKLLHRSLILWLLIIFVLSHYQVI